jgi:excinuclease ABC subunit A
LEPSYIVVKGAREHNLEDVNLRLPRGKLICFTGVSGSGKSSLAFDTLYAEGQRRYIESLSSYARQFLGQMARPDVDSISGLSPSISIQQKAAGHNPRSTVGTVTEIYDFLRVLFSRAGIQHCPQCGQVIAAQTREQIIGRIQSEGEGAELTILAPVVRGQKGEYKDLFVDLQKAGFLRARVDGQILRLSDDPRLDRRIKHDIEVVVDRLKIRADIRSRLGEAVDQALLLGEGSLIVHRPDRNDRLLSCHYACQQCELSFEPPTPQMMSFNSPAGMCPTCDGLGEVLDFDPELLVPDPSLRFFDGAIKAMWGGKSMGRWKRHIFEGVAEHGGFELNRPWSKLTQKTRDALLYGTGDAHIEFVWRRGTRKEFRHGGTFPGVIAELRKKYRKSTHHWWREWYEQFMISGRCSDCRGGRLVPQARAVRIDGKGIDEVCAMTVEDAREFFDGLGFDAAKAVIAEEPLKEIRVRLKFLTDVGLGYLALDRKAPSLSGGESQRIRLAGQIGSGLVGVLYILDEPSIGLHHRDNARLLDALCRLRDMGNTVVVVEHDEDTMRRADHIVDFGPGPGVKGGKVVAAGSISTIKKNKKSVTGQYLTGQREIEVPAQRRPVENGPPGKRTRNNGNSAKKKKRAAGGQ